MFNLDTEKCGVGLVDKMSVHQLVPVIVMDRAEDGKPLAEALIEGGLPVAEVTMRTSAALGAMKQIGAYSDILLGAGTVLTADQVDMAVDSGASYIISPGMHEEVVERCLDLGVLVIPGVITPSDIAKAMSYGLDLVKFFPAESFGGAKTLKAMAAPYGEMRFVPTGGINAGNVMDYLTLPSVAACGGSWMVERGLIQEGNFTEIVSRVRGAVDLVKKP
ncbi:MAG: bifunctional 4-hydroxy-2-oxoglutarate aldolase/2-dehydro-3-deoxy-phosphogluconate aldolase [Verrucomicrobiae bacterium]|nr:bifunctional 4-hydroxy-2-oxoglutarate aldolase/2-dehydro-3-deoxy-phosphogluconate aldolase [Verrucomicrobiae bacterium]NNJ42591.1 bifunctional 4-hydroxy-2-oxoglutarate aldolase/2-dehydro-3-deoxy-phosphogluconate aldolase [Akkermansiaceae bacterium]